jgi:hypothetical protein
MLQAVRGLYTRRPVDTNRGRPARFAREDLLQVDSTLRMQLGRETSIGVRSFVGQYLPILDFPRDVREPLERGDLNLFEAHQLARLTAKRLNCSEREARTHRRKLLEAHLLRRSPAPDCVRGSRMLWVSCASQTRCRRRWRPWRRQTSCWKRTRSTRVIFSSRGCAGSAGRCER